LKHVELTDPVGLFRSSMAILNLKTLLIIQ